MIRLSNATLNDLPPAIRRPHYDRSPLRPGIIHIGLGNFHRAHQSWYLHRLMQDGMAQDWAIIGAGVRAPHDAEMRRKLAAQDWMTTLIELDPKGRSAEVVGSMVDYVPVEEGNGPLIAAMADPAIRIVALTVTEGGYYLNESKGLNTDHPDIRHDAAHPDRPKTAFGAMVAALSRRRAAGLKPFTGQSCDNLQGNGAILRQTVLGLARLSNPDLARWIEDEGAFPNSMVDCIVPATGPAEIELVKAMGVDDAVPVTHENFRQWVIEDHFCLGRPDWDRVGATFSDHVHDYERMKIRVLNAGHQVISDVGDLLGIVTIADTMADEQIAALLRRVEEDEILPHVAAVPDYTPAAYLQLIERRFSNPAIRDTTRRVAFDGSSRHPGFVLPSLRDQLAAGGSVEGLALVEALWARYCTGVREDGSRVEPNDPHWPDLVTRAERAKVDPRAWLVPAVYGDLAAAKPFADAFAAWLQLLHGQGARAALTRYLAGA